MKNTKSILEFVKNTNLSVQEQRAHIAKLSNVKNLINLIEEVADTNQSMRMMENLKGLVGKDIIEEANMYGAFIEEDNCWALFSPEEMDVFHTIWSQQSNKATKVKDLIRRTENYRRRSAEIHGETIMPLCVNGVPIAEMDYKDLYRNFDAILQVIERAAPIMMCPPNEDPIAYAYKKSKSVTRNSLKQLKTLLAEEDKKKTTKKAVEDKIKSKFGTMPRNVTIEVL